MNPETPRAMLYSEPGHRALVAIPAPCVGRVAEIGSWRHRNIYKSMTTRFGSSVLNKAMKQLNGSFFVLAASALLLAGCATSHPTRGTSRYQVSSWAIGTESHRQYGCFVIDTWTGEVWNQDGIRMDKLSEMLRSRP